MGSACCCVATLIPSAPETQGTTTIAQSSAQALNPLATAALVMIGLAQVSQAWTALQPTPQETHFRVVQEFCKSHAKAASDKSMRHYIECMSQHARKVYL